MTYINLFNYKYLAVTDTKGARISITNKSLGFRTVVSWNYTADGASTEKQVADYLTRWGYTVLFYNGSGAKGVVGVEELEDLISLVD